MDRGHGGTLWLVAAATGDARPIWPAVATAAAVLVVGITVWRCGWLGGGDVKLIAALSLWAGPGHLASLLLATALCGGLLALAVIVAGRLAESPMATLCSFMPARLVPSAYRNPARPRTASRVSSLRRRGRSRRRLARSPAPRLARNRKATPCAACSSPSSRSCSPAPPPSRCAPGSSGAISRPQASATPEPVQRKAVLVAAVDLTVGSFVQPNSLRWQDWPDVALPESYLVRGQADEAQFVGAVVRQPLTLGQPLTASHVVKPGERGFLAAVLEPGMRAISVPVDEAAGNAGLVFPGDRVDLILTQSLNAEGDPAGSRRVSETVLEDLRVIAMGRRLSSGAGEDGTTGQQARTATLEATPQAAEKIALVAELGKLALSLRSLALAADDDAAASGRKLTWDADASPALRPENQPHSNLAVIRGDKLENISIRRGAGS